MAQVRVIGGRRRSREVTVQTSGGAKRRLLKTPNEFTFSQTAPIAEVERAGRKALTRVEGEDNKRIKFSHLLAYPDPSKSVQADVDWLRARARNGDRVKFTGMPPEFAGWWFIVSLEVDVQLMTPAHRIARAELSWQLVEAVDHAARVRSIKAPPKSQPSRSPVRRTHTVKSGDTLSHIALRYLGKATRWPEIYRLNKSRIRNPNLIFPGQTFKIPPK